MLHTRHPLSASVHGGVSGACSDVKDQLRELVLVLFGFCPEKKSTIRVKLNRKDFFSNYDGFSLAVEVFVPEEAALAEP